MGEAEAREKRLYNALSSRKQAPDLSWHVENLGGDDNHVRGGRSIFRLIAPNSTRRLILKIYDAPGAAGSRFRALKRLNERTDHVVRPLFLMPRFNLFAMEDVGEVTVLDQMCEIGNNAGLEICAKWFSDYTRDVGEGHQAFDATGILSKTTELFHASPRAFDDRGEIALRVADQAINRFSGRHIPHVRAFGDFKPGNLCISESGQVVGIDHLPSGIEPPEREIAFLLHWVRQKEWRDAIQRRCDPPVDEEIAWQIVSGQVDHPLDRGLVEAFLDIFLLRMWIRLRRLRQEPKLLHFVTDLLDLGTR